MSLASDANNKGVALLHAGRLAEAEAWLAEASASYAAEDADSSTTIPTDSAAPPVDRPTWPAALYEMGSEAFEAITGSQRGKKLLGSTVLAIRAVRLARSSACRELCNGNILVFISASVVSFVRTLRTDSFKFR